MTRSRFFAVLAVFLATLMPARAQLATSAEHAILMDAASGQVLWAKDAFTPMPPASMSKLMTLELVFQRLKDGRLKLSDTFPVSERAWSTQGSKMFVKLHDNIPVEDLIQGVIVDSGNDACVVLAEGIGGTVDGFVQMMNARAKELGLKNSTFVNPDGLPDPPGQAMSAFDLATLARHIIRAYPQYYHYFSQLSFTWSGITQNNRDRVMGMIPGGDGLKTGHTDAAGYGIVTSAVQHGERLILVLNGLRYPDLDKATPAAQDWKGSQRRSEEAARILAIAFREFRSYPVFKPGEIVGQVPVVGGAKPTVAATAGAVDVVMQVDSHAAMKVGLRYYPGLQAPIAQGQRVGTLEISAPNFPGLSVPVTAAESVPQANIFWRMFEGMMAYFHGKH